MSAARPAGGEDTTDRTDPWRALDTAGMSGLSEAVPELHWAVQYLAAAGQTFAEPADDDSHRAMTWEPSRRAFVSAPFAGAYPFRAAIRPEDLTLLLLDRTDQPLATLPLGGRPREEGFEWMSLGMATYMGGLPPHIERPEYDMPPHPVDEERPFSADRLADFARLGTLFDAAAAELTRLASERANASDALCWPHHFDIATLMTLPTTSEGRPERTVGAGFAPRGGGYERWYWYVTPWPYPAASDLPPIAGPGRWHTEGWTGAVLTAADVLALDPASRRAAIRDFLREAVDASIQVLGG